MDLDRQAPPWPSLVIRFLILLAVPAICLGLHTFDDEEGLQVDLQEVGRNRCAFLQATSTLACSGGAGVADLRSAFETVMDGNPPGSGGNGTRRLIRIDGFGCNVPLLEGLVAQGARSWVGVVEQYSMVASGIRRVQESAFRGLSDSLKHLDLSFNSLGAVPEAIALHLPNLQSLNLGHNQIAHLDSGSFSGLGTLRVLDLSNNR